MSKLKDIEKIVDINIDIKEMEAKLKKLRSQEFSVKAENERTKRDTDKYAKEINAKILKDREDIEDEIKLREKALRQKMKDLTGREKLLIERERESRDLDADIQAFNKGKKAFAQEKKDVQKLKSIYIDSDQKANLLIARYNKLTGELPKKKR